MNQARLPNLDFAISAPCRGILEPLEITHSYSMVHCYAFVGFEASVAEDSVL